MVQNSRAALACFPVGGALPQKEACVVQRGEVEEFHAFGEVYRERGWARRVSSRRVRGPYPRKVPPRLLALFTEIAYATER